MIVLDRKVPDPGGRAYIMTLPRGAPPRSHGRIGMQLEERSVGDIVIVAVKGDITLNNGSDVVLRDKVRSLIQQGRMKLIIDLGHVSYMDSAGLGELGQAYATTKTKGGSLKLLGLTKRLKDLLAITKLATVFESFDQEADAIASFSAP